jgi:hypothetical protein
LKITAARSISLPLLILKTPALAIWAPVQNKLGGRNLWRFRPSSRKQAKHQLLPLQDFFFHTIETVSSGQGCGSPSGNMFSRKVANITAE